MRAVTWRAGLGEFSDCLVVGLVVAVASIPVVTAAPAVVAGCRAIGRTRSGVGGPLWTTFWADFRAVLRGGLAFGLGCLAAGVLLAVDFEVAGELPGAGLLRPVLGVLGAAAVVIAVRTCQVVSSGELFWRRALITAARATAAAPAQAALLAAAIGLSAVLVWMLPILALVVAGPLCLAAVATGGSR
ncbi:DUF624 domain-containing protein [Amycolatopsis nalaikhensis]|uniref:DUF624 domain-containing protein n=1 Tax=Amycolatopsis nalaikhensis TaxID=715472 RepID=A0ABY8XI08_9PSEU|nr:DUF624 domain-containing protein [Amycolatopsis sp. 2-2]WIV55254.1 DUF624 domain-containing protein [Amycolatopsis sp. 2-2]